MRFISVPTWRRPTSTPSRFRKSRNIRLPANGYSRSDAAHQREVLGGHRLGLVIDAAAADVQDLGLADDGKVVGAVDHRFALSMPALMSAPSKKSFSSASSPILA